MTAGIRLGMWGQYTHFRAGFIVFAGALALALAALAACSHDDECAADSCDSCACAEVPDAGGSSALAGSGGPNGGGGSAGSGGSAGIGGATAASAGTGGGG